MALIDLTQHDKASDHEFSSVSKTNSQTITKITDAKLEPASSKINIILEINIVQKEHVQSRVSVQKSRAF